MHYNIDEEDYVFEAQPIFFNSYTKIYNCTKGKHFVKSLYAKFSSSNEHEIDYKKIYQITQKSNNQNLVPIYHIDYDFSKKQYFIIMEKCQENLEQQCQEFNEMQIKDFLIDFIKGYKCLHGSNLFHGKINANNIFIIKSQNKYQYKIGDIVSYATSNNTNIGYIAPEIFPSSPEDELYLKIQSNQNQVASDIYSLGMVLIRLINGKLPFECTRDQVNFFHYLIKSEQYKINKNPFNSQQKPISEELLNLVQRMIKYNPEDRLSLEDLYKYQAKLLKQKLSQTINYPSSQIHFFSTIKPSITTSAIQFKKSKSMIQPIQRRPLICFKNLTQAKIRPEYASINPETQRMKAIKRTSVEQVVKEFIDRHWTALKNGFQVDKEYAASQIYADNREFMLMLLNSYNNIYFEIDEQEILFIYCLLAKVQGYREIVKKTTSDYKAELLDV
ncbi:unnamed protein product [Paramecium octaurelia]|uniref:Protein kinase domain-containing protein n=1 Tax=Paramecium octaurelia TaxID=43137 RepID=A0A8S1Y7X2_PAROT|nr:unnamed protein product [Paramecium octaurelia]